MAHDDARQKPACEPDINQHFERIPALRTPTQYKLAMIVKRILLDESEWSRIAPDIERNIATSKGRDAATRVMTILRIWYDAELTPLRAKLSEGDMSVREFGTAINATVERFYVLTEFEEKPEVMEKISNIVELVRTSLDRTVRILREIDRGHEYDSEVHDIPAATFVQLSKLYGMAHTEYEGTILPIQRAISRWLVGVSIGANVQAAAAPVTDQHSTDQHSTEPVAPQKATVPPPAPPDDSSDASPDTNLYTNEDIAAEIEELTKTALMYGGITEGGASHAIHLFLLANLGKMFGSAAIIKGIRGQNSKKYTDGNIQQSLLGMTRKPERSIRGTFRLKQERRDGYTNSYGLFPNVRQP